MAKVKNDIQTLEFPENVRTRPVMYMNDIIHSDHALTETVDNAADHVFRDPSVKKIAIKTAPKNGDYFYVANDGSSFPIGYDPKYKRTKMHLAVDHMHAGANYTGDNTSVGQNGIGLKGTNALSSKFWVITLLHESEVKTSSPFVQENYKEGEFFCLHYQEGKLAEEFVGSIDSINKKYNLELPKDYTTYVVSFPDPKIYETQVARVDEKRIETSIIIFDKFYKRKVQYILDGRKIEAKEVGYKYNTLVDFKIPVVNADLTRDFETLVDVRILLNYEFDKDLEVMTSGGNVNTRNVPKGQHINLGREKVANALKNVFDIQHNYLQKGLKLDALVLAPGSNLQLAGQTKDSLIRIKGMTDADWDKLEKAIIKEIKKNKDEIQPHIAKLNEYAMQLDKLNAKDFVKSMVSVGKNTGVVVSRQLVDAINVNREECTLFIVEGRSAAGTLKKAREVNKHAVFAMRGFCLNVVGKTLDEVFKNEEFKSLVSCMGAGVDTYNDIDCLRYGKVVIATDSDPDGAAISSLLLSLFGEHLRFLIEAGKLFINESPLYYQDGNYFRADEAKKLKKNKPFTRFKGLGELNEDQAYDVFFGNHQRLIKITEKGIDKGLELMSSTEKKKDLMVKNKIIVE